MAGIGDTVPSRRGVLRGIAAGSSALAFEGAMRAATAQGADTIRIGALNVYTKGYGIFGEAAYKGMMLYLDEKGGAIAGRKVEIIREDDEFNPQVGLQKLRKLVESDKVHAIMGPLGSHVAVAMVDYLRANGTPWIITGAGATDLTKRRLPNMFRPTVSNWQVAYAMGEWAAQNLPKDAAIVASDFITGHDIADSFKESYIKGGGKIVKEIYPPMTATDFSAYVADLRSVAPGLTYCFFGGTDAARFVKQFDQFGLKGKSTLVGFQSVLDTDTFSGQGKSAIGGISSGIYSELLDTPENKEFVARFKAKYKAAPGIFEETGYSAMRFVDEATKAVGGKIEDRDAFSAALAKVKFVAPRGPLSFDPVTHQTIQNIYIRRAKEENGAIVNEVIGVVKQMGDYPGNKA
jgi:branched-chain amino acid transport system substrate-binding protein